MGVQEARAGVMLEGSTCIATDRQDVVGSVRGEVMSGGHHDFRQV